MTEASIYRCCMETSIKGRYITLESIEPLLNEMNTDNQLSVIGRSVRDKPIYLYSFGRGHIKVLMWSQMHGNESTTTKALIDFLNMFKLDSSFNDALLITFKFYIIPILNPDGAELYTRENANGVDLNRDIVNLTQPESRALKQIFDSVNPHFCYNLHDQRSIFGAGDKRNPATVSFLAPAYDEYRNVNKTRLKAMNLIVHAKRHISKYLENNIGRFDDTFNINCAGDYFQSRGVPTILIEAGHCPDDYERDITRRYIFSALINSLDTIKTEGLGTSLEDEYLSIPPNKITFFDFIYKNIKINYDNITKITNFAAHFKEELKDKEVHFVAYISEIGDLEGYFGHSEYDAKGELYRDDFGNCPQINNKANFYIGETLFVNGMKQNNN